MGQMITLTHNNKYKDTIKKFKDLSKLLTGPALVKDVGAGLVKR